MNSSKTCIDKQISENKFIINLKEYKNIKEINLQYLLDQITINKHIGHVQFNKELIDSYQSIDSVTINKVNVLPDEDAKMIKKINDQLILNNSNFNTFTSDKDLCLMCKHVYNDQDFKLNDWKIVKSLNSVPENSEFDSNKAVLFQNDKQRQLVLAFQGLKLSEPYFNKSNNHDDLNKPIIDAILTTVQQIELLTDTLNDNKSLDYFLTFTGYSFGALLAESSLLLAKIIDPNNKIRCTTFESPGSFELLACICNNYEINENETYQLIYSLDIVTYLISPNIFNSYSTHVGLIKCFYRNKHDLDMFNIKAISLNNLILNKFILKTFCSLTKINLDSIYEQLNDNNNNSKYAFLNEYYKFKDENNLIILINNNDKLLSIFKDLKQHDNFVYVYANLLNNIRNRIKNDIDLDSFKSRSYCRFELNTEFDEYKSKIISNKYHDQNDLLRKLNDTTIDQIEQIISLDKSESFLISEQLKSLKNLFSLENITKKGESYKTYIIKSTGNLFTIERIKRRYERLIDIQKYILIQNSKLRITIPSAALTEYNSGIFLLYFGWNFEF